MYDCDHPESETRRRVVGGGAIQVTAQCLTCGHSTSNAKPHANYNVGALPEWDKKLESRGERQLKLSLDAEVQPKIQRAAQAEAEWRGRYEEYLLSDDWLKRRKSVLKRSPLCQGCLMRRSCQVHHTTYKHLGNEFAFELLALCGDCHDRYHTGEPPILPCTHCGKRHIFDDECPPF